MTVPDRLISLLMAYEERRERGESVTPEEICADSPELLEEFHRQLGALHVFEEVNREPADGRDPLTPFELGDDARYRPGVLRGRGGLGEVYVASDVELGRQVALKRIRPEYAARADARRRFLREAMITARLEHPGIVPVYGLIRDASGRPCYAMRLIEGESLGDAIRRARRREGDETGAPAGTPPDLRSLLARLVAACNAVAFAHSRGVVHRDLTPNNIMLGPFGETLVVDWGLATTFAPSATDDGGPRADPGPDSPGTPPAYGSPWEVTHAFGGVGTPGYRAPEQLEGRPGAVAPAADVYSLGAILLAILTGSAPKEGVPPTETRPDSAIARPLWSACRKAMAPEPDGRYRDAGEYAADLDRWLAGDRVLADSEPWPERAARWSRRHRTAVAAATVALIVALLAIAGGAAWASSATQAARQVGLARADLDEARRRADRARGGSSPTDLALAAEAADRAVANLDRAGRPAGEWEPAVRLRDTLQAGARLVEGLEAARVAGPAIIGGRFDRDGRLERYRVALREAGLDPLTTDPAAGRVRVHELGAAEAVVAALDDWSLTAGPDERARLAMLADQLDRDARRKWLRALPPADRPAALVRHVEGLDVGAVPRPYLGYLAEALVEARQFDAARGFLDRARDRYSDDLWFNHHLGTAYRFGRPPDLRMAERYYREAIARAPRWPGGHISLGEVLHQAGEWDRSADAFRDAIRLDDRLAIAQSGLGNALIRMGDFAAAEDALRKAIDLEPKNPAAHSDLSFALTNLRQYRAALDAIDIAIDLDPTSAGFWFNRGYVLQGGGDVTGSISSYRQAIELNPDYGAAYLQLGNAYVRLERHGEAIPHLREAVRLLPPDPATFNVLGGALFNTGDFSGALDTYRKGMELGPLNPDSQSNYAVALFQTGDVEGGVAGFREAIRSTPGVSVFHANLSEGLLAYGDLDGAVASASEAVRLAPADPVASLVLGNALLAIGDRAGAESAYRDSIVLAPEYAEAHCSLGLARMAGGEFAAALGSIREGHRIGATSATGWPHPSAMWIHLAESAAALGDRLLAIERGDDRPDDAAECLLVARIASHRNRFAAAARLFEEASRGGPARPDGLGGQDRELAARSAVMASLGRGIGEPAAIHPVEGARLRALALSWMQAELEDRLRDAPEGGRDGVRQPIRDWMTSPEFAGVRTPVALASLPMKERRDWARFWSAARAAVSGEASPADWLGELPADIFAR